MLAAMRKLWLVAIIPFATLLGARPVEAVMIDEAEETALGKFPFDRAHLADAVEAIQRAGARATVLKFFFDQARPGPGDRRLARAIHGAVPVILQARLDDREREPNPLPERFFLSGITVEPGAAFSGRSGWLPLPMFAEHAAAIGFIDGLNPAPIVEVYRGKVVPSLFLLTVELMLGRKVVVTPNRHVRVGARQVPLDARNGVALPWPRQDALDYVPLLDVLRGAPSLGRLKDKVVIVGYDGPGMHSFDTPVGKIKAHRLFYYQLCALYDCLAPAPETRQ